MIYTLTLNPAIDRILYLPNLEKNVTNRIRNHLDTIGGKGTHVSINLQVLNEASTALGIAHGKTGQRIIKMLTEEGIQVHFNHYDYSETRTNYLLIEDNTDCTIIAEAGVYLNEEEINDVIATMEQTIGNGDYLILSGDASNSPDASIYNRIIKTLEHKQLKIFLDSSGNSLIECMHEAPFMIKPNLDELSYLCKRNIPETDRDIIEAIHSLAPYGIEVIAVSLGKSGSIIKSPEGLFRAYSPEVNVINTCGCGDAFLSGFVHGLSTGRPMIQTIRLATAVSAATAESSLSAGFNPARAKELENQVIIKQLQ